MMRFEWSSYIPASIGEVFAFHERKDALQLLTPPEERVSVVRRSGVIEPGAFVELQIRVIGPISVSWVAHHTEFEKNVLFVDEQRTGPFTSWRHEHRFIPENDGTRLVDSIDFALPGGQIVERFLGAMIVRRLSRVFAHRHKVTLREVLRRAE